MPPPPLPHFYTSVSEHEAGQLRGSLHRDFMSTHPAACAYPCCWCVCCGLQVPWLAARVEPQLREQGRGIRHRRQRGRRGGSEYVLAHRAPLPCACLGGASLLACEQGSSSSVHTIHVSLHSALSACLSAIPPSLDTCDHVYAPVRARARRQELRAKGLLSGGNSTLGGNSTVASPAPPIASPM